MKVIILFSKHWLLFYSKIAVKMTFQERCCFNCYIALQPSNINEKEKDSKEL